MNNFFSSNLKYLREKRGIDQSELAKILKKKSASTVSEWENGKYTPKIGVLNTIASFFGISISDLMEQDLQLGSLSNYIKIRSKKIPLLGTIAAGTPILAQENIDDYIDVDSLTRADFALRVTGDSMIEADILDGDIVFIRKQDDVQDGQVAAVLIVSNDEPEPTATLKRVYHTQGGLMLSPANSKYKPIFCNDGNCVSVEILGFATHCLSSIK